MWVNPFWFGVLMTIVGAVVVVIIFALIASHRSERLNEINREEQEKLFEKLNGKKFVMKRDEDGCWYGEEIEDPTDDDCK